MEVVVPIGIFLERSFYRLNGCMVPEGRVNGTNNTISNILLNVLAKHYVRNMKGLEPMVEALEAGLPVDLSKVSYMS